MLYVEIVDDYIIVDESNIHTGHMIEKYFPKYLDVCNNRDDQLW